MKPTILLLLLLINIQFLFSQKRCVISGTVTDAASGEQLVSVSVYDALSNRAVISNFYGYYSINLPSGKVNITYSYVGYKKVQRALELTRDTIMNITLETDENILNEVVVKGQKADINSVQTGVLVLKTEQIKNAPVLMGEADLLKTLQLIPGVKGGIEGTGGIYVRGGSPDQNLILLDGVPLYNTNHAFGFFSIFNPDAISGFTFYKGGMPARFGGRLSSVLDIKMKEGNNKEFTGEGSIGLISSKLTLEGPLFNENTSFIISGRRTIFDLFTRALNSSKSSDQIPNFYFYDLNAKINHRINSKNRLYLSLYSGGDYTGTKYKSSSTDFSSKFNSTDGLGWGNLTSSLRWNYLINNRTFSNITATYSKYQFKVEQKMEETFDADGNLEDYINRYTSGINDFGGRWDIEYYSTNHNLRGGVGYTHHMFNPGVRIIRDPADSSFNSVDTTFGNRKIYIDEAFVYAEDEINVGRFNFNIGLHYSLFSVPGKQFTHLQPRLSVKYQMSPRIAAKLSYGKVSQYLHLLTNSTVGMPTDLWLPATARVKPQRAQQYSLGLYFELPKGYNLSTEVYYKKMNNLIEYKEGASFYQISDSWEDKIESGRGRAQGVECFLQKMEGRMTGWIGVTLSKADRTFKELNNGLTFPYRYDSRLDVSALLMYKLKKNINLSANWLFHTGNAITLPLEKIRMYSEDSTRRNTMWIPNITKRNNFRTPSYHRLDISIDFIKQRKHTNRIWSLGIYNVYNRLNAFYIYTDLDGKIPKIKKVTIFPILPYVKYTIKF